MEVIGVSSTRSLISLSCDVHKNNTLALYCRSCKRLVCPDCDCCEFHDTVFLKRLRFLNKDIIKENDIFLYQMILYPEHKVTKAEFKKVNRELSSIAKDLKFTRDMVENGEIIKESEHSLIDKIIDLAKGYKEDFSSNTLKEKFGKFCDMVDAVEDVEKELTNAVEKEKELSAKYNEVLAKRNEIYCKKKCLDVLCSNSTSNFSPEEKLQFICVLKEMGVIEELGDYKIHSNIQDFCSFPGCGMLNFVKEANDKTELNKLEHISVYEKVEFKEADTSDIINLAISHNGIMAAYFGNYQDKICIYDIISDLSYTINGISNTTYIGFYDNNIVLCTNKEEPKYDDIDEICRNESLDSLKSFEDSKEITGFTNLSDIQVTRKMIYPTEEGIYLYNLDEHSGNIIYSIKGCHSTLTASGININDIICFYLDDKHNLLYLDNEYKSNTLLSDIKDGVSLEMYSILPSTTSENTLNNAIIVTNKGLISASDNTGNVEFKTGDNTFTYQKGNSIIRLYNNIFLVSDAKTGSWCICKIIVH